MKSIEVKLSQLKYMRSEYYKFRCYPKPTSSPYDKEIAELEKQLEERKE